MVAEGLVAARPSAGSRQLGWAYQALIERRSDLSNSGREKHKQARSHLCAYFGEMRELRSITVADAKDFARKLSTDFAVATASAHTRKIKHFFRDCVDRQLIEASPFADLKGGKEHNPARVM